MTFRSQLSAFTFGVITAFAVPGAHAQVALNAQFGHPAWGPAVPAGTQYYYVPEIDGYYDLAAQRYLVLRNGQWVPVAAAGYNPASFHPVVVDYRGRQPWTQYRDHHARYYRPVVVQPRPVVIKQRTVLVDRGKRGRNGHDDHGRGRH